MVKENTAKNPMLRVMKLRDFRLLFSGSAISLLGDQFALIATPWLVLKLTNDPLVLGIVLALEGIPRAVFMLLGGAITDRFSPRIIMLISDIIRLILTGIMAFVIVTGLIQIWMLYAFGLGFGLVAGFAIPAQNSIVPLIVDERDLQGGNSLILSVTQLVGFVGPTVAGIIIGKHEGSYSGISMAFIVDSITFGVSAVCLWLMRKGGIQQNEDNSDGKESILSSIATGVKFMWGDREMRLMFLIMMAVNFLLIGPIMVGIPVLADHRLPQGAAAFGLLMSAFAGGNMIGYLIAGSLPRPGGLFIRILIISLFAAFGIVIGSLGFVPSTWVDFSTLFSVGLGNGYLSIILFTWIQTRAPKDMLGRIMSILMFSSIGLVPVSQAISGAVIKLSLTALFSSAGVLVLIVTFWAAFLPEMKSFSENLVKKEVVEQAEEI